MNEKLMADLLDIHGRLEALHGALRVLTDPADVARAAEVIDEIETAAYEAALIVSDDDGVDDDREEDECTYDENALGVAIQATFSASDIITEGLAPEVDADSVVPQVLSLLIESFGGYHLASHQVYVYREGKDENDAYIGIEVPASRLIIEVDELSS